MSAEKLAKERVVDGDHNVVVDNELISYDAGRYDFGSWIRQRMNDAGYDVTDLTQLHRIIPYDRAQELQNQIIKDTAREDFVALLHGFVHEVLEPIFGAEIAVQRYPNIRLMLPGRSEMKIAYHTGVWYGHGLGQATCWMPFTPVSGSNSMYVVGLEDSRRLMREAIEGDWDQQRMHEEFSKFSWAIEAGPGQAHLFNQEIIHGNATNETPISRVSCDFRLAVKGGPLRRKRVGGYFTLLDPSVRGEAARSAEDQTRPVRQQKKDYTCIGYVNNSTLVTSGIPIVVQRLMMRDYMQQRDLRYTYQQLENEAFAYLPTLKNILGVDKPDDVVLYSIYALPDRAEHRRAIYELCIDNGVTMHFANEDLRINNRAEAAWVEANINFARLEPVARLPQAE